jgi:hypothetical protein
MGSGERDGLFAEDRVAERTEVPSVQEVRFRSSRLEGSGRLSNLSSTGALIETPSRDDRPESGSRVRLTLVRDGGEVTELLADVVRTTKRGFGVAFADPESQVREALEDLLDD